jgi:hypothetical protein
LKINGLNIPIDTTALDIALLGKLSKYGWALGQKCQIGLNVINGVPDLFITKDSGLSFKAQVDIPLSCIRNGESTEYSPVFTIRTQPIIFKGSIEISKALTIKLHIDDFDFNIDTIVDSHVGVVNTNLLKGLLKIFEPAIKTVINIVFSKGIDIAPILKDLGLDFIKFEKTLLMPFDNYFLFFVTPEFKIENLDGIFQEALESMYAYLTSNVVIQEILSKSTDIAKSQVDDQIKNQFIQVAANITNA